MRNVYGISNWPEEFGKEFLIFKDINPSETNEQAIIRAKELYAEDIEVIIKEGNTNV